MESNYIWYDPAASRARLDEILEAADAAFEEASSIPLRSKLTFTNGFYVYCTALFADIRGSSELPQRYYRPTLSKLYRAYISEMIAVMNGDSSCAEVMIVGDAVAGVFDTPFKSTIDEVFATAARANSLVDTLNCKLRGFGIEPVRVGIGLAYGRALMIKAGFSGSGINDVSWMGDVVNEAANLSSLGSKNFNPPVMVSSVVHQNLNDHNRGLLSWNGFHSCYSGNVIISDMNQWVIENC